VLGLLHPLRVDFCHQPMKYGRLLILLHKD
jgi:hypothetical protein